MAKTDKHIELKKNSILSIASLFLQSGYAAVLGLIANFTVTYLLSPTIFGIYILTLSIIAILNYFSDIGLAGSLIQKKELTDEDIRTTFTVQQIMILSIISLAFFLTPYVLEYLKLPDEARYLYWALLASFFISSLKTIPSIFLERKVQFQKIVYVQIIENTVFYLSVIILAILGFKVHSFTYAVLIRAVTGWTCMYAVSPWIPQIGFSMKHFRHLLAFGAPFQANSFLALIKDELIFSLYLGNILGPAGVGYIGWAKKWAEAPIRIIMDNISRVLFPVFSRIQDDKKSVSTLIETILKYQTMIIIPSIIGLALIMKPMIELIPRYDKWEPALPLFYIFCISTILSSYSTPFINALNALGKIKISFRFMIVWTVGTWLLTPFLTTYLDQYGMRLYGFPLTQLILSLAFFFVIIEAKKMITFNVIEPIYPYIIAAVMMGGIGFSMLQLMSISVMSIIIVIIICASSYIIILQRLFKVNVISEFINRFLR